MEQDFIKKFIDAMGLMSEMTLTYYRALITSGATKEEASTLVVAFIEAMLTASGSEEGTGKE